MRMITEKEIKAALDQVGITDGQIVMVHSDLSRIGWVSNERSRAGILNFYFESIAKQIGNKGTIVVLSCTESYARNSIPFDYEKSPSEQGVLSEFVRKKDGAVRSMHPLFSLTALGEKSHLICGSDICKTGFGYGSPFHKLREMDARILCIGVDLLSMTFVHHIEQTYGVPYGYTKEWDTKAYKGGEVLKDRYFAFVRYLNAGVNYNFGKMQTLLLQRGLARKAPLGLGAVWSVRAVDVFNLGIEQLKLDPFFFLENEPDRQPWKN